MGWWEVDREGREGEGGEPRSLDVPELALLEVVIDPLVPPRDDTRRRIRVPGGEVLAVWPALRDRTSALSFSLSLPVLFPPLFSNSPFPSPLFLFLYLALQSNPSNLQRKQHSTRQKAKETGSTIPNARTCTSRSTCAPRPRACRSTRGSSRCAACDTCWSR